MVVQIPGHMKRFYLRHPRKMREVRFVRILKNG